jgi:protein O-GlcNAc transferase
MKLAVFDSGWEYSLDTPYNSPLGGTQSAICFFLEEMANNGHEIYLFNKRNTDEIIRGVIHVDASKWQSYITANKIVLDIIIVSCIPTEVVHLKLLLNEPLTMFCLWTGHDIDQPPSKLLTDTKLVDLIDLFIFVSDWQRLRYLEKYNISYSKTLILRNGIGKPFEQFLNMPITKNINSMSYCSIPWRGLNLLVPIYKKVKERQTNASLKIFSGMNIYKQQENPAIFNEFKQMDSVTCSYGVSQTQLANELYNIDYLSYPNTFQETSCITVLQAMACGCIVITSNLGALKETMGGLNEYIDINIFQIDIEKYVLEFIIKQLKLMKLSNEEKDLIRETNRNYIRQNYLYSTICKKFEKDIDKILNNFKKFMNQEHRLLINNFIKFFESEKYSDAINNANSQLYYPNINEYYVIKLNLGVCYHKIGNNEVAMKHLKIAKNIKEDFNVYKNIALIEMFNNNINKFIKYARKAISFEFDSLIANLLAEKYEAIGCYHESMGIYKSIIDIEPDNINCLNNLGNIYLIGISDIPDFKKVMNETYGKSLEWAIIKKEHRKKELIVSNIIFNNLYNWKTTNDEILTEAQKWYTYFPKELKLNNIVNQLQRNKIDGTKIKIGYISTDFITHPVGYMFDSILKNHNTDRFQIFCYDNSNQKKAETDFTARKLRSYNNAKWFVIENKTDQEILQQIVNDDLDILVDMMGHTRNTRMNILQYKPARVIISYFAYPSTNGLKEIDYRFTDKYATPPNIQKYFVEKLYYLPNGFQCYTPPQDIESIKDYTRDKYKINLCCFNNPIKLSKPTIETFAEVLKRLPQAKLYLRYCYYNSSYIRQIIIKQFIELGIEKERLDIGSMELLDALNFYNKMDIVLDPFPYNGGTISSEAIYMNTPLITLAGSNYVSRVGVSLLSNLGLEKYIANTREEYVQKVVNLAQDPNELKELHQTLRIRMLNSDLANSFTFTKNIEIAYEDIVNKFNTKEE